MIKKTEKICRNCILYNKETFICLWAKDKIPPDAPVCPVFQIAKDADIDTKLAVAREDAEDFVQTMKKLGIKKIKITGKIKNNEITIFEGKKRNETRNDKHSSGVR